MTPELFRTLVSRAAHAPSVHNVQPARWRQSGDTVLLFEDLTRRLPAADPTGFDAGMSLGAALEGFVLAAGAEGFAVDAEFPDAKTESPAEPLRLRAVLHCAPGGTPDPLSEALLKRQSWRKAFAEPTKSDRATLQTLEFEACTVSTDQERIGLVADWNDAASLVFQRDPVFRAELLSWMRLSRAHPRWDEDGLNADSLQLTRLEALGAGVVLGRAFSTLDTLRLAAPLISDASLTRTASAVAVFHMPETMDPISCGRAFHRDWLRMEIAGFGAAVLAALADDRETAERLHSAFGLPPEHRVISAFRIGRRTPHKPIPRVRLSTEDLLV